MNQRLVDDGRILSYEIKTDLGYDTTRHRRFLRPLMEKYVGQPLTSASNDAVIPSILEHEVRAEPGEQVLTQTEKLPRVRHRRLTRAPVKLNL